MGIRKHRLGIIVLSGLVLAGGGMIGYKFYEEEKNEAGIKTQQQEEKQAAQEGTVIAETKVISAEMNPIEENIEEAEEAVYLLSENEDKRKLLDRIAIVNEEFNRNQKVKEGARLAELKDEINQAKIALDIDQSPSEKDIADILHNMTHQKVRSEDKWGFVQITEVNLLALKEVLQENPAFNQNIDMLTIVTGWLNNHFGNVVAEHNLIWNTKNGSVGKAYGILSPSEEAALVKEQFGSH
jgi:hypothetical protein